MVGGRGLCFTQALLMNWRGQCPSRLMSSSRMKTKLKAMLRSSAISPSRVVDLRDTRSSTEAVSVVWLPARSRAFQSAISPSRVLDLRDGGAERRERAGGKLGAARTDRRIWGVKRAVARRPRRGGGVHTQGHTRARLCGVTKSE